MDGFRNPGKDSSPSRKSHTEVEASVATFVSTVPLQALVTALGADAQLHLVGGVLRDIAEGKAPGDLDVATALPPQTVIERLEGAGVRVVPTGLQHGTVLAVIEDRHVEITTFRRPGASHGVSIEEDLSGRDFTINALAYAFPSGTLIDKHGSLSDIFAKRVRAVGHAADRFQEDPLRILRALRFGPAAGRSLDSEVEEAIRTLHQRLLSVSPERIRLELERILMASDPAMGLREVARLGLLSYVLPEAIPSIGFEQNRFHTQDVFEHTLTVIARTRPELTLRLAALFHDLGKPHTLTVDEDGDRHFYRHEEVGDQMALAAMERLRFSHDTTERVRRIVRHHMRPIECGPAGVRRLLRDLGDDFSLWREFKLADSPPVMSEGEVADRLQAFDEMVTAELARRAAAGGSRLAIRGQDILNAGFTEGPLVGKLLKALEESVIENPNLNSRETLLALLPNLAAKLTGDSS